MTADLYKAEATRLAEYLAETHGIKLKHTSILAAVATLHGARDWNTLIARNKPGLLERAAAVFSPSSPPSIVQKLDDMLYSLPTGGLSFGLPHAAPGTPMPKSRMAEGMVVADRTLLRHTLLVGPVGYGWGAFIESLASQQVMRGGGMLVLDPRSDPHLPALLQKAASHADRDDTYTLLLDDAGDSSRVTLDGYDVFAGGNPRIIAQRLSALLLPDFTDNAGADYYRTSISELLTATLEAMSAAGLALNLVGLSEFILQPVKFFSLLNQLELAPGKQERLQQVLSRFIKQTKNGAEFDESSYRGVFGALTGRLYMLNDGATTEAKPLRSLDVAKLLAQNQVAYVGGFKSRSSNGLARAIVADFMRVFDVCRAERSRAAPRQEVPFLLVVPMLPDVLDLTAIRDLLRGAQEANVALVFQVSSLSELEEVSQALADDILTNMRLKVVFKQSAPRGFTQAVDCLEYASGDSAYDAVQGNINIRERLHQLGMGEALFFDGQSVRDLRICIVGSR